MLNPAYLLRGSDISNRDLNSGKSTLINTLLRRTVVPEDQQPCTSIFVEVIDANGGMEQVHGIRDSESIENFDLDQLHELVESNQFQFSMLKVFVKNQPSTRLFDQNVKISLIDSPGLNIDSIKTTSLFSKQEEIDVIIFVVNAENHFTQSGREFLESVCKEKAYVFIVVNKFDSIEKKEKCKSEILEQLRHISPRTFDTNSLVYFVSCRNAFNETSVFCQAFAEMEEALSSFVLGKRLHSKLFPAKLFLDHILSDLFNLTEYNMELNGQKMYDLNKVIGDISPEYDNLKQIKAKHIDIIDDIIEKVGLDIIFKTEEQLQDFNQLLDAFLYSIEWDGPFSAWHYSGYLSTVSFRLARHQVQKCIDFSNELVLERLTAFQEEVSEIGLTLKIPTFANNRQLISESPPALLSSGDGMDIISSFIPSLTFIGTGILGYQSLLIRKLPKFGKMGFSIMLIGGSFD
jgi:mitofusin